MLRGVVLMAGTEGAPNLGSGVWRALLPQLASATHASVRRLVQRVLPPSTTQQDSVYDQRLRQLAAQDLRGAGVECKP
jgi:hypothetical protein